MKKYTPLITRYRALVFNLVPALGLLIAGQSAFAQVPNGTYKIINRQSGQALNVTGSVDVSPISQYPYNGATNKQWTVNSIGNGQYTIQGVNSGLYVTVASSSTADNAVVQLYHWQDQPNFKVTLTPTDSGHYRVNFVHSGKAMAVSDGSLNWLAQIVQVTTSTQTPEHAQWKFVAPGDVASIAAPFTMVVLPDTQSYCSQSGGATAQMFYDQTNWINAQRSFFNIKYVMHLGDIVDDRRNASHWAIAKTALYALDNTVPYGVVPGNHDWWDNLATKPADVADWYNQNYNAFFGAAHFEGKAHYGGSFGNSNNNHYDLITANGIDFVIVFMEWHAPNNPNIEAINWVNSILQTHSDRRAIVVSHELIDNSGSFKTIGQMLFDAIKGNRNLFMIWCGHYNGEGSRVESREDADPVYICMSDYQDDPNGGNGKLKIMSFVPAENLIKIETYSPTTNLKYSNTNAQMTVPFPMGPIDGAIYELEPLCAPGKRLEVAAWGNTNGSNVQIWRDRNQTSQRWLIQKQTDGAYELIPQNALGMRMDVAGGSTTSGSNVQIWADANVNQQRWILECQSDGSFELIPKHSATKRLDVQDAINADGTNVQIWGDNSGPAQRWRLIKQ